MNMYVFIPSIFFSPSQKEKTRPNNNLLNWISFHVRHFIIKFMILLCIYKPFLNIKIALQIVRKYCIAEKKKGGKSDGDEGEEKVIFQRRRQKKRKWEQWRPKERREPRVSFILWTEEVLGWEVKWFSRRKLGKSNCLLRSTCGTLLWTEKK